MPDKARRQHLTYAFTTAHGGGEVGLSEVSAYIRGVVIAISRRISRHHRRHRHLAVA